MFIHATILCDNVFFLDVQHTSDKYHVQGSTLFWSNDLAFPGIPGNCIIGYQLIVNNRHINNITCSIIQLESSITKTTLCKRTNVAIQPILLLGNTPLTEVLLTGSPCNEGKFLT